MQFLRRFTCAALLCFGSTAVGQEIVLPWTQHRSWDVALFATAATGEETTNSFAQAQITTAGLFVGKMLTGEHGNGWRAGALEYGVNVTPVFVQSNIQRVYGVGFEPIVLRWNSSLRASRVTPYIELAGGGISTQKNLPPGNTSNFNFTARAGGGIQIVQRHRQSLDIGLRWFHISNANLGVENPEFNGIQLSVGYHWFR